MNTLLAFSAAFLVVACYGQNYCPSGPTTTVDSNLGYTNLQGDSRAITDTNDCPGRVGAQDLTYLWADIHPGGTYTLNFNVTTCGNFFPTLAGAWIDFDHSGFFEPTELLFPYSTAKGLVSAAFTVNPALATVSGMTRMRVQVQETQSSSLDACAQFPYGGTKDFNISIGGSGFTRCPSGPTTTLDGNLGAVFLQGDSQTINDTRGCPGVVGPIDDTAMEADLTPGTQYALSYEVSTCGGYYVSLTSAWIDFNNDSKLEDWERIVPFSQTFGTNVVRFTVPESTDEQQVISGRVWMRVQMQETNAVTIDPCFEFPYGGTKDFSINLRPLLNYCVSGPKDLGSVQLGPVSLQGSTRSIVENTGCPGGTGPQNFLNDSADLIQGQPWLLSYSIVNCGTNAPFSSSSWIDFDQDGLFEPWEQITPTSTTINNIFQFKVPPSTDDERVLAGSTRLRVQVQASASAPLDPCANFQYGGTKDFSVVVLVPTTGVSTVSTLKMAED